MCQDPKTSFETGRLAEKTGWNKVEFTICRSSGSVSTVKSTTIHPSHEYGTACPSQGKYTIEIKSLKLKKE